MYNVETLSEGISADMLTLLNSFINAIDNTLREDFGLVLDDYHCIETEAIHTGLAFLLEHLPPKMHLILITRVDPPLPLARLRVRGYLTEIRTADLRFTRKASLTFSFLSRAIHRALHGCTSAIFSQTIRENSA